MLRFMSSTWTNRTCSLLFILLLCLFLSFRPFSCISFHKFSRDNSSLSHSVLPVWLLPYWSFQLYISSKFSLSPDIILCGWLGLKRQLTNLLFFSCFSSFSRFVLPFPQLFFQAHFRHHSSDLFFNHLHSSSKAFFRYFFLLFVCVRSSFSLFRLVFYFCSSFKLFLVFLCFFFCFSSESSFSKSLILFSPFFYSPPPPPPSSFSLSVCVCVRVCTCLCVRACICARAYFMCLLRMYVCARVLAAHVR